MMVPMSASQVQAVIDCNGWNHPDPVKIVERWAEAYNMLPPPGEEDITNAALWISQNLA